MARHIWSIICQQVLIDRQTNLASYINAIEAFHVNALPAPCPTIFVGTLWQKAEDSNQLHVRLRVHTPSGKVVHTHRGRSLEFKDTQRFRVNLGLGGFPIEEVGEYAITVEQKVGQRWKAEARIPLPIELSGKIEEENG